MRITTLCLWAATSAFAAFACSRTSDPSPSKTPAAQTPTVKTLMKDHEKHGAAMRDAVARGELDAAKHEARILAGIHLEGSIDAAWRKKLEAMNAAASRVAGSQDIREASRNLGGVAKTCGDCHTLLNRPGPIVGEFDAQASGAGPLMLQHEWAATALERSRHPFRRRLESRRAHTLGGSARPRAADAWEVAGPEGRRAREARPRPRPKGRGDRTGRCTCGTLR